MTHESIENDVRRQRIALQEQVTMLQATLDGIYTFEHKVSLCLNTTRKLLEQSLLLEEKLKLLPQTPPTLASATVTKSGGSTTRRSSSRSSSSNSSSRDSVKRVSTSIGEDNEVKAFEGKVPKYGEQRHDEQGHPRSKWVQEVMSASRRSKHRVSHISPCMQNMLPNKPPMATVNLASSPSPPPTRPS